MTASKGIVGTLDGFIPWGMAQAVAKGAVFSWGQAACAKALHNNTTLSKETKTVITGGVGGFVQGIVMSPLLLLKTRVMTDPVFRTSGGLLATAVASAKVRRARLCSGLHVLFVCPRGREPPAQRHIFPCLSYRFALCLRACSVAWRRWGRA